MCLDGRTEPTLREWIRRIDTRASGPGGGNSILRSIRPGRSSAESRISARALLKPQNGKVEKTRTNSIRGHDDFDVFRRLEPIQLVEQLQHRPLHL